MPPRYTANQEVIVHTKDGHGRENGEWPGKITAVARKYATIEYEFHGGSTSAKFNMETHRTHSVYGDTLTPWFETPAEKKLRLAATQATEVLKKHGFEPTRWDTPSETKIIAVAKFLSENFPEGVGA